MPQLLVNETFLVWLVICFQIFQDAENLNEKIQKIKAPNFYEAIDKAKAPFEKNERGFLLYGCLSNTT